MPLLPDTRQKQIGVPNMQPNQIMFVVVGAITLGWYASLQWAFGL